MTLGKLINILKSQKDLMVGWKFVWINLQSTVYYLCNYVFTVKLMYSMCGRAYNLTGSRIINIYSSHFFWKKTYCRETWTQMSDLSPIGYMTLNKLLNCSSVLYSTFFLPIYWPGEDCLGKMSFIPGADSFSLPDLLLYPS